MVLYEGMYDVVCKNPELCEGFLDLLNVHIIDMFGVWTENTPIDVDTLSSKVSFKIQSVPPVIFEKMKAFRK